MKSRSLLLIGLIFFSLISQGADNRVPVTLQLKWWHQFQFAGYYAAVTQGYYAKEGLQVKIVAGDSGRAPINEVLQGKADFGITGCDLLTEYAHGKPLIALGAIFQHSPYIIISPIERQIHSPSDLIGKTIMASENQGWIELKAVFLKEGIDIQKLHIISHTWNNQDLANGRADAMTGYRSVEPYQLTQLGITPSYIIPATYGIDFYGDILFSSRQFVESNPQTTAHFRDASFKGWEYAMSHKEEMCNYILSLPGVKQRKVTKAALLYEADEMEKLILPQIVEVGHMNEGRWNHIRDIQQSLGLIPSNVQLDDFIYTKNPGLIQSLKAIGIWVVVSIAGIFILVLVYSLIVRRTVKLKTKALQKTLDELRISEETLMEKNAELKKLSAYLQNTREDERKRIAREVHDELGQLASVIKIDLDWLNIRLTGLNEAAKKRIAHAISTTSVLLNSIRKTAAGLRPSILDDFGLNAALKWQCNEFQQLNGVACSIEASFDDKQLTMEMKTELFRIVQECLTNVMRHAEAKHVTITTREDSENLFLTIADDGTGFDPLQQKNTLGLIGLRERAQSLNGTLLINSSIGKGTTVTITIPKK